MGVDLSTLKSMLEDMSILEKALTHKNRYNIGHVYLMITGWLSLSALSTAIYTQNRDYFRYEALIHTDVSNTTAAIVCTVFWGAAFFVLPFVVEGMLILHSFLKKHASREGR